ncbi:MAG: helix-turn-helix transcriptional regulator [Gemmobacter sp.]
MIAPVNSALDHMRRIVAAETADQLWHRLIGAVGDYGFDRVVYGCTRTRSEGSLGDIRDAMFLSNHPGGTEPDGFDMRFFMRTPMFRWAMTHTGACSWRWAEDERDAGRLTTDEIAAMDAARRSGRQAGYTISFADPSPRAKGAMGLTARPDLSQPEVDALWQRLGQEIEAICTVFHLRMGQMPIRGERRPLSPRQREALEWVAEGKTTQDIAQIMGVSPAMVEKHLRLAREALDVETTAHAVAKAALLNQLFSALQPAGGIGSRVDAR